MGRKNVTETGTVPKIMEKVGGRPLFGSGLLMMMNDGDDDWFIYRVQF